MKKLIGAVAIAAVLATSAFAEINFGAWLRVLAAPVAYNGDDITSGMTNSWGGGARPARLNIDGTSEDEKVGFSMGVYNDAWSGLSQGDNVVIWAKPWDFLKVSLGRWDYTTFRGDLCYGSWAWLRPNTWIVGDEGLTFDQLGAKNGIQLELTPVEGLVIMWNLPLDKGFNDAYKMFEGQDIAAKYTIGDIGTVKLGWGGQGKREYTKKGIKKGYTVKNKKNEDVNYATIEEAYAAYEKEAAATDPDTELMENIADLSLSDYVAKTTGFSGEEKYYGDINVAFDLTAVENLFVTVGVKFGIASSDYKKADSGFVNFKGAIGASYQILDNLKLSASYAIFMYENKDDPAMQFGVGVDVGLTDSLALAADFRAKIPGNKADPSFSFLVGVDWNISSNGQVGIGFQGLVAGAKADGVGDAVFPAKADKFNFAVPIKVGLNF